MKKTLRAVGITAVGIIAIGVAIWIFLSLGLDAANKLAGVLSFFVAGAGLIATVVGLVLTAKNVKAQREATRAQKVSDTKVGGDVNQVLDVDGSVTITRHPPATAPTQPAPAPPPAPEPPTPAAQPHKAPRQPPVPSVNAGTASSDQSVTGSDVTGDINQVNDVGKDVNIER